MAVEVKKFATCPRDYVSRYWNINLKTGLFDIKSLNYVILTSSPKPLVKVYVFSTGGLCSVQFSSVAQSCPTICETMDCSMPGFPVHHQLLSLLKLMSIESVMLSNDLIFCCPLLLPPSIFPSIKIFSSELVLRIRWLK